MSIRKGYWWVCGDRYGGPFQTIKEAKAEAPMNDTEQVTIRALVSLEKRDVRGEWQTLH